MKIGMEEIHEALHEVAIQKLKRALEREHFEVVINHTINLGSEKYEVDLYATNDNEKRIYEIKVGKNKISRKQFESLQRIAKSLQAKLFVTYLEAPRTKEIEFDGVDSLIFDHLVNNIPSELDVLSTHTTIENVDSIELTSIKIKDSKTVLEGNAVLDVNLQYGSTSDMRTGIGDETSDSFDFYFRLSLVEREITNAYFKFDLEHFYE